MKLLSTTPFTLTTGATRTLAIPALATGNLVVVTCFGEAILTDLRVGTAGGTAFTRRTAPYSGGASDIAILDLTVSAANNGATSFYLALNGQGDVGGTVLIFQSAMTFAGAARNAQGGTTSAGVGQDWSVPVTASTSISANSVLLGVGGYDNSGAPLPSSAPARFGPLGRIVDSAIVPHGTGWVSYASAVADVTPTRSYPENLAKGAYRSVWQTVGLTGYGNGAYAAQAVYTDPSGVPTVALPTSRVAQENSLPGVDVDNWWVGGDTYSTRIAGYCDRAYYAPGDTVGFKVDSASAKFRVEIYRLGFYGSDRLGARNVLGYQAGYVTGTPTAQPTPTVDPTYGSTSCAWKTNATWTVPADACPGVYSVVFRRTDSGQTGQAAEGVFVVRGTPGPTKAAVLISDSTWQAYNSWGSTNGATAGRNLYEISTNVNNNATRAYAVSFDRPYRTKVNHADTWLWDNEMGGIVALESQGYDLTYHSMTELDATPNLLNAAQAVILLGHQEYWSTGMYNTLSGSLDAGVNAFLVSSNSALWHVRFAAADSNRRLMICYKESLSVDATPGWKGTGRDPVSYTGTWRDPRTGTAPNNPDVRRENAYSGQLFNANAPAGGQLTVPYGSKGVPMWRNSPKVMALSPGQSYQAIRPNLGDELDWADGSAGQPANLVNLAPTTLRFNGSTQGVNAAGSLYNLPLQTVTVGFTLYRRASGALVFNTGAWRGFWGVTGWRGQSYTPPDVAAYDLDLANGMLSMLYDLGVRPSTFTAQLNANAPALTDPAIGAPAGNRDAVARAYGLSA